MPTYEFNQGFERAYLNNKELVGGPYPTEDGDWGFGDGSSFTQLRTRNGLLQWVNLRVGGQRITFTDLRDMAQPKRYILMDPPDNRLVEVQSPGRQNPDTGEPIDQPHHDQPPSPVVEPPPVVIPGPQPPPIVQPPPPAPNELRISAFSGGKTLGQKSGYDIDAWKRAYDEARHRGGEQTILYDVAGEFRFEPVALGGVDLTIRGFDQGRVWLFQDPSRPTSLLRGFRTVENISFDGSADRIGQDQLGGHILLHIDGWQQVIRNVTVRNFAFLGVDADSDKGSNLLENVTILGTSPGGDFRFNRNQTSFMGIHTTQKNRGLTVRGGSITRCGLNGIFTSGLDERIEGVRLLDNHWAYNQDGDKRYGGGEICFGGRNGTIAGCDIGPSDKHASGIELDGDGHTVHGRNRVRGHPNGTGIVCQRGRQYVADNDIEDERTAISIEREARDSSVVQDGPLANRIRNCAEEVMRR